MSNYMLLTALRKFALRRTMAPACPSTYLSLRFTVKRFDMITVPDAGEGRVVHPLGDSVTQSAIREHVGPVEFYRAVGYCIGAVFNDTTKQFGFHS